MFCSHSLNGLLNQIHERTLRLTYNDHVSSFENIPEISNEKTIHQQNLEFLAKEIYKFVNGLLPPIMSDLLYVKIHTILWNFQTLYSSNKRTVKFGVETISYKP